MAGPVRTSNWTQFKWPYAPLDTFTRSEPFPTDEVKATYIGDKPKNRRGSKALFQSLLSRKRRQKGDR